MYIGWLSIKHKQIYFEVSFVKQTINKRRKHCTSNNKRTMVCYRQGCRDISRYAIYRDIFLYIAICDISRYFLYIVICDISRYFFWSYRDTNVHGYTEIDGRIDGERRKYTNSHSADATSVCTYIRIQLRCCVHQYIL